MNNIKTVHVVFKTHLDIGFTNLAHKVIDQYKQEFIPKALSLAEELSRQEDGAGFVWTTGSWLIQEYLSSASPEEKARMEEGIRKGHIAWHGLPFTTHTELIDSSLFQYGLSIAKRLDHKYGKRTVAAKMTDVPGHTRSIVSHMAAQGLEYLHIGVNHASKVPSVPPMFVWRDASGSEIIVNYAETYGDMVHLPGLQDVLYFAHTGDNNGPPSIEMIRYEFARLKEAFPGAIIQASTMDAFVEKLLPFKHTLPVLTEEIGDTWIHGVASDPKKIAIFREVQRTRTRWIEKGELIEGSEECNAFSDNLLLVAEHTWGMDEKKFLGDYQNYAPHDLAVAREKDFVSEDAIPFKYKYIGAFALDDSDELSKEQFEDFNVNDRSYRVFESSWQEQRDYLNKAISALSKDKQEEINKRLERLQADDNAYQDGQRLYAGDTYSLGVFQVSFATDGSIEGLVDGKGKAWTNNNHRIGTFVYESFGVENYNTWFEQYIQNTNNTYIWSDGDFGKPGMENVVPKPRNRCFYSKLESLRVRFGQESDTVEAWLEMPLEAVKELGCPSKVKIEYTFHKQMPQISINVHWFSKQANRLPEAIWFSVAPLVDNSHSWKMDKIGGMISPYDVVKDGNRNLHAIDTGVYYQGADGNAKIVAYDSPVVAPGQRRLLQFDNTLPSLEGGFHFNLYNNIWGTNFPMWFEEDCKFRFDITLQSY